MVTVALVILFLMCAVLAWFRKHAKNGPANNEPPVLPGAWPFLGHAQLLLGDTIHADLMAIVMKSESADGISGKLIELFSCNKHSSSDLDFWSLIKRLSYETLKAGGVLLFHLGPSTLYLVTDPEDSLVIANTCLQKAHYYEFAKPWLGDGLFTAGATKWKKHRQLINPAFNQVVLDGFLGVFNEQSRCLVKDLEIEVDKGPFDLWAYTRHHALKTICLNALGTDITEKNELNNKYVDSVEQIFNIFVTRFQKFWLQNQFLFNWSSLKKRQDECVKILHNMSNSVLKKKKANYMINRKFANMEENTKGPKPKPFMDLLLELSVEKGAFSDEEIREQVDTIIITGHDTSASTLMFTMLLVGSYPQIQKKISEELLTVFGNEDRDVTAHDLSRLLYLEAVIKESLRIYPIAPLTARRLDRDVKLRNWTLKKGGICVLSVYGLHRHLMWGPDAEGFRPERWLDPATLPECPHAFAAFNIGRRNCIGKPHAYMSLKTSLVHLLRRYSVSGDHTKLVAKFEVFLKPVSGHYVTLERK